MSFSGEFSRRKFIRTTALGSAAVAVGARGQAQSPGIRAKPNLIVFLPDQLRADTVVGMNAGVVHAPNIHKLAEQSVIFDRAYVTHPVCVPSRLSLLTGLWPHQTDCRNNSSVLPSQFLCLPEMLGDSTYQTGYLGKWHLGDEFFAQHGFNDWVSIIDSYKKAGRQKKGGMSDYSKFLVSKGFKPDSPNGESFGLTFATRLPLEQSRCKFLETKVCEFLERRRAAPFILFVAFFEPHPPYNGPLNNEHRLDAISLDPTNADTFGDDIPLRYRLRQELFRHRLPDADHYRETKQKYFGLITEVDRSIGAILDKLAELGLNDRTIVALTSDHGEMIGAHGLLGKTVMYEQSASVPYLIRLPGQQKARHCSELVSHIDFTPTMLDLLGKPPHPQCVGRSKAGLVRGEPSKPESIFMEWSPGKEKIVKQTKLANKDQIKEALAESTRAVVTPDSWKLCLRDKDKNELYNLRDDPEERHNLFYANKHNEVIGKLTAEIHDWQQRTGDTLKV